jgi:hypothetical protein
MTLQPDFKEFLHLLLSHRVRFVIVGAHALAAHGKPRFTGDIDVFVEPTQANARRLLAALSRGAPDGGSSSSSDTGKALNLRRTGTRERAGRWV